MASVSMAAPDWRVVKSSYPTDSTIVAGYSVHEFGANADGKTDSTKAFQKALDAMYADGGGTVFVPEGFYVLRGSLTIPSSVTLRGEWREPTEADATVKGTVLMAYADKGDEDATPLIRLKVSAGIRDLSIWYPQQRADQPVAYPYTLAQDGFDNATFKNLTLVNPYKGIQIGPKGNELHYVHNVYGTPLKKGIRYDSTTDIGRLEKVTFSSRYWAESGLPGSRGIKDDLERWLYSEAVGLHMLRSDWEYVDQVSVEGYNIGFMVTRGVRGSANAQFRKLILKNCATALSVEKTNPYGMVFSECVFEGNEEAVVL
ncbi:MAG: glycosyl hydrolase family 28-related protein, partial [Opitutales bacterium]